MSNFAYIALIDVLAYRSRLEKDQKNGTHEFKDDLTQALLGCRDINTEIYGIQAISDTIIMSCTDHNKFKEFLINLTKIYLEFLKRKIFIRGGVSYGKHFRNTNVTYSHALAAAYELESMKAIYPRIMIDKNIIDMYSRDSRSLPPDNIKGNIIAKYNNSYFLNILAYNDWDEVYSLSKTMYEDNKDYLFGNESAFSKHKWFENYLFSLKPQHNANQRYIDEIQLLD